MVLFPCSSVNTKGNSKLNKSKVEGDLCSMESLSFTEKEDCHRRCRSSGSVYMFVDALRV